MNSDCIYYHIKWILITWNTKREVLFIRPCKLEVFRTQCIYSHLIEMYYLRGISSATTHHHNKAIRDGRPRPPRHQVGWDIVRRECACQISWWSVEKWRRYYILKFHGNTFRWPTTLTFDLKFWVPILNVYVKFHDDRLRNDWDITLWNFAKTRTNTQTHKHTNTQTHKQTWALQYLALPLWGAR